MDTHTVRMLNFTTNKYEYSEHYIYTLDEAKERDISYYQRPFHTVVEVYDWIRTDDDMVAQVLKVSWNTRCKLWQIRIANGTFLVNLGAGKCGRHKILAKAIKQNRSTASRVTYQSKMIYTIFAYSLVMTNFDIGRSFQHAFNRPFVTKSDEKLVKRILNTPTFVGNIMKKINEVYKEAGLDPASIVKRVDELFANLVIKAQESKVANDIIVLTDKGLQVAEVIQNMAGIERTEQAQPNLLLQRSTLKMITTNNKPESSIFDDDITEDTINATKKETLVVAKQG